MKMKPNNVYNH